MVFTPRMSQKMKAALLLVVFWERKVRRFEAAAWGRRSIARAAAKETTENQTCDMKPALGVFK